MPPLLVFLYTHSHEILSSVKPLTRFKYGRTLLCSYMFVSSGSMDCMLSTFENRISLMRWGAPMVWHLSLSLMNSFNKTEAAIFRMRAMFR